MIFRRRRTAPMTITTCDVMFFLANKKQMAFLSFFLFYEHFIVRSLYSNPVDMAASIAKPSFKYNYAKRFDFFIITFLFIPVHLCSSVCFFFPFHRIRNMTVHRSAGILFSISIFLKFFLHVNQFVTRETHFCEMHTPLPPKKDRNLLHFFVHCFSVNGVLYDLLYIFFFSALPHLFVYIRIYILNCLSHHPQASVNTIF